MKKKRKKDTKKRFFFPFKKMDRSIKKSVDRCTVVIRSGSNSLFFLMSEVKTPIMSLTDWDLLSRNMYSVKNPLKPKHKSCPAFG